MSYSDRLLGLLRDVSRAFEKHGVEYAVGGAVAMAAYGYERGTTDIDFFVNADHKPQALRTLRTLGLGVAPVHRGTHYIASVPRVSIERMRIDVLFPESDPDWSAVQLPDTVKLDGVRFEAFPLPLLFLAKAQAVFDGGDYEGKHESDLRHLIGEGLVDEREVMVYARRLKMAKETKRLLAALRSK